MPSDVQTARLNAGAQALLDGWPEDGAVVTREQARVMMMGAALVPSDDLGAAWRAAEEALPEGWNDLLLMKTDHHGTPGYAATATGPRDESGAYTIVSTTANGRPPDPTPAAAVAALAEFLASRLSEAR